MKHLMPLLLAMTICVGLLTGCGTSKTSSMEESTEASWADLTLPSASPSAGTVMPTLEIPSTIDEGTDVTSDYIDSFVGTWVNEDEGLTYEFMSNENLVITHSSGEKTSYTYWFTDTGSQIRLCIYENGADEAETYSFSQSGDNITLYDVTSGDAIELLTRKETKTETETETAAATEKPTETAAATATPSPSPSSTATAAPTSAPTAAPSASSSPSPSPSPSPVEWPAEVKQAMPAIDCALDVIQGGGTFSDTDTTSFWNVMARYVAQQGGYTKKDGYAVLTPEEMLECAQKVYAGLDKLPECPDGSAVAIHDAAADGTSEQYRLQLGNMGGVDFDITSYNGKDTVLVTVRDDNNAYDYEVKLDGSAIVSIKLQ